MLVLLDPTFREELHLHPERHLADEETVKVLDMVKKMAFSGQFVGILRLDIGVDLL